MLISQINKSTKSVTTNSILHLGFNIKLMFKPLRLTNDILSSELTHKLDRNIIIEKM